uniref:Uncharacterized protein n=1 Tax=Rhizophora mucronata TaxID=61149 RepID=A0A2P2R4G2_RHIMU
MLGGPYGLPSSMDKEFFLFLSFLLFIFGSKHLSMKQ